MNSVSVMTERAFERIAAGASLNFAGSDLFEISDTRNSLQIKAIHARGDAHDAPLVVIAVSRPGDLLPEGLRRHRVPAYQRMLSFVQRASKFPVSLPRGWRQYKHNNLLAFFALPEALHSSQRWIAEINPEESGDVIFWAVTQTGDVQLLADFDPPAETYIAARSLWRDSQTAAQQALSGPPANSPGVDVTLEPAPKVQGVAKSRAYSQWLPDLTACQREFVEAPSDKSIRLRGPAGSGKTLTMCIKAVKEAVEARRASNPLRVLFVTHSWSLAGEVDDLLVALSEVGPLTEINTLPLVAIAQEILPHGMVPSDLRLIGDDSLSGKSTQLSEIEDLINEFENGDWITYKANVSADFAARLESVDNSVRRGLAWDLLVEFGCVLGADGIFPAVNAEQRYLRVPRTPWMMRLDSPGDRRVVYALYVMFYKSLQERNLLTSDQLLNDFLNYLESFTWNHRRLAEGYDLVFVDEYHLFNTLERQILRYLGRDVASYPHIFMALDPRQSPWAVFDGAFEGTSGEAPSAEDALGVVKTVDIPTVHRSSPQILELIKHIHLDYANLSLDDDWNYSLSDVESLASPGPVPTLFASDTFADEELAIFRAVGDLYSRAHGGVQLALAILDEDAFRHYSDLINTLSQSEKYRIIPITNREDVGALQYHRRGLVVGPAEYLAGLQFDTVLVAGLPALMTNSPNQSLKRRAALSLLYLAISRASREVRIFTNEDLGGIPEVLLHARDEGVLGFFRT